MTRVAIALALVLGSILAWVGLAGASSHGYATRATIKQVDEDTYNGRVFSSRGACVGHRKIELWKQFAGPNQHIDTFKADADGRWSYAVVGSEFYVIAKRTKFAGNHVCREDRSPTV